MSVHALGRCRQGSQMKQSSNDFSSYEETHRPSAQVVSCVLLIDLLIELCIELRIGSLIHDKYVTLAEGIHDGVHRHTGYLAA